ncbi:hypothetical protein KA977_13145 [Candidatus Dependentiae bacterium]|nr:hypothetical protein [Candidatus Dependentiae bacterium]
MKTKNFQKGFAYKVKDKTAYYLGIIDGINIFKLSLDCHLHLFYFEKNKISKISSFEKNKIEMFKNEELPEDIKLIDGNSVEIDDSELLKFIFTAKPMFPNSAFCPEGKLEELFERKGIIFNESDKIELNKKYRAVNPSYCIIKNNSIYRQTDMWEKYPDLILKLVPFDKKVFLNSSDFKDDGELYLSAVSSESYGGTHKDFDSLKNKVTDSFDNFTKGSKMAEFKRTFVIKEKKSEYFNKLGIDVNKIILLKKSV